MENPFTLSDHKMKTLLESYTAWAQATEKEKNYAADQAKKSEKIKANLLNKGYISGTSDEQFIQDILEYSKTLEGPANIQIGKPRVTNELEKIKRNLLYLIDSPDDPFEKATKILEGDYKIPVFAKAFWSPIFQAQYPEILPNWNNKTENFLQKVGINLKAAERSMKEKYRLISDAFIYLRNLDPEQNFHSINHLMHYGTVIPEGCILVDDLVSPFNFTEWINSEDIKKLVKKYIQARSSDDEKQWNEEYKWAVLPKAHNEFNKETLSTENLPDKLNILSNNNPQAGSFVHWNNIDDLKKLATKYPNKVLDLLTELFQEAIPLHKRIDNMINVLKKINKKARLGTPLFGFILAVHDYHKYPIYKDSIFQAVKKWVGKEKGWASISLGMKYEKYRQLCIQMGQYFKDNHLLKNITFNGVSVPAGIIALDGQDFFYLCVEPKEKLAIWWVNQGATLKIEREGGFLWAPLETKGGQSVYHWDALEEVKKGDIVIHYANGALRYASRVKSPAVNAKRPEGMTGGNWDDKGRLVQVEYHELNPLIPHEKFFEDLKRLNIKQGPIDSHGGIKQGYLFRFSSEGLDAITNSQPATEWPEFFQNVLKDTVGDEVGAWIFQGNPKYYDVEGALKSLKEMTWEVNQHKDKIHSGDTAYLWQSGQKAGIFAVAEILSEPKEMPMPESENPFVRKPERFSEIATRVPISINRVLENPITKEILSNHRALAELRILKAPYGSNFSLTNKQASAMDKLINEVQVQKLTQWGSIKDGLSIGSIAGEFKIDTLYFEKKDKIEKRIQSALKNEDHIMLIGPPGTGKSKLAKEICEFYCIEHGHIMCTATSDWSTFETIGGYRPDSQGMLKFYPGIFLQCFQNQHQVPINKWLIIDEINRADIDKAFGSLFSALTGDDICLPFEVSGESLEIIGKPMDDTEIKENLFIVPPDWRIIATMNTYDKASLYEMSYAFMRRFAFIPVDVPSAISADLIKRYINIWGLEASEQVCSNLSVIWSKINEKRKVGPAIIEDMYKHVVGSELYDYASAIIMYVFPQFEGLVEDEQIEFIREIMSLDFMNSREELKHFAADLFDLDIAKFK